MINVFRVSQLNCVKRQGQRDRSPTHFVGHPRPCVTAVHINTRDIVLILPQIIHTKFIFSGVHQASQVSQRNTDFSFF